MNFQQWMTKVDEQLAAWFGVTSSDLIDWTWRDAFDDEISPRDAVEAFIEEAATNGDVPMEYLEEIESIIACEEADNFLMRVARD